MNQYTHALLRSDIIGITFTEKILQLNPNNSYKTPFWTASTDAHLIGDFEGILTLRAFLSILSEKEIQEFRSILKP